MGSAVMQNNLASKCKFSMFLKRITFNKLNNYIADMLTTLGLMKPVQVLQGFQTLLRGVVEICNNKIARLNTKNCILLTVFKKLFIHVHSKYFSKCFNNLKN